MCRMCLVDVDTGRGPALAVSCMTNVAEGMKVDTFGPRVKKAQEGVLEFLLINHPLDCPVCDKGGECPLQDQTLSHGPGESRFVEEKRHYAKPIPISDVVYLDRERCILCDRCTRFAKEVAGDPLIQLHLPRQPDADPDLPRRAVRVVLQRQHRADLPGRRPHGQAVPVQGPPVGPRDGGEHVHDVLGRLPHHGGVEPGPAAALPGHRRRRRQLGLDVRPRPLQLRGGRTARTGWARPLVRKPASAGDELVEVSWAEAIDAAAAAIRDAVDAGGPGAVAVLGGARGTNEDAYAWAKLAKGVIGTDHVDAQLGDGLPAERRVRPAAGHDRRGLRRHHRRAPRPRPQGRAARPVPAPARRRRAARHPHPRAVRARHRPHALRLAVAAAPSRRAGGAGPGPRRQRSGGRARRRGRRRRRDPGAARRAARWPPSSAGPTLASAADFAVDAAAALLAAHPAGPLPDRAAPRQRARCPRDGPGARAAAGAHRPGRRRWRAAGCVAAAAAPSPGSTPPASSRPPPPARIGCLDPARRRSAGRLPRRATSPGGPSPVPARWSPSTPSSTASSSQADVVLAVAAFGEKSGTTTNLEGRVSPVAQKVTAAGHGDGGLDDRRRAGRAPRRRPRARLGGRHRRRGRRRGRPPARRSPSPTRARCRRSSTTTTSASSSTASSTTPPCSRPGRRRWPICPAAPPSALNPWDADRRGFADGTPVQVIAARTSVVLPGPARRARAAWRGPPRVQPARRRRRRAGRRHPAGERRARWSQSSDAWQRSSPSIRW